MKLTLIFFCALLNIISAHAQNTFLKLYGTPTNEHIRNGRVMKDGSLILGGYKEPSLNGLLIRTDANGDTLWTRTYKFFMHTITESADTAIIIAGTNTVTGNLILGKVNRAGQLIWVKKIVDTNVVSAYELSGTSDNGFLIAGNVRPPKQSYKMGAVFKVDSMGDLQWSVVLNSTLTTEAVSAAELANGDVIASSLMNLGSQGVNTLIYKISSTGNMIWIKKYSNSNNSSGGARLLADGSAHFFALISEGYSSTLARLDSSGNIGFTKRYGNNLTQVPFTNFSKATDGLILSGVRGYSTTGITQALLVKTNFQGDTIYTQKFRVTKPESYFYNAFQLPSGGVVAFGKTTGAFSTTLYDFFTVATDSSGRISCSASHVSFPITSPAYTMVPFPIPVFAIPGFTSTTIQQTVTAITPTVECQSCTAPANATDITATAAKMGCAPKNFVLSATGAGTLQWFSSPTSTLTVGTGLTFSTLLVAPGQYTYYVEARTCTTSPARTAITVTLQNCTSIGERFTGRTVSIWPNPAGGQINLEFHGAIPEQVEIFNSSARSCKIVKPRTDSVQIETDDLSPGVYVIRIYHKDREEYQKLMVLAP